MAMGGYSKYPIIIWSEKKWLGFDPNLWKCLFSFACQSEKKYTILELSKHCLLGKNVLEISIFRLNMMVNLFLFNLHEGRFFFYLLNYLKKWNLFAQNYK